MREADHCCGCPLPLALPSYSRHRAWRWPAIKQGAPHFRPCGGTSQAVAQHRTRPATPLLANLFRLTTSGVIRSAFKTIGATGLAVCGYHRRRQNGDAASPLATSHSGWMHALSSFAPRPLRSDLVCDDRVTRARRLTSIATASVGGLRRCLPVLRRSTRGQIRRYRATGSLANSMPALIAHALVCTGLPAIVTVDLYAIERTVAVAGRTAASRSVLVGMSCEQVPPRCNADQREAAGVALQRRALPPGPLLGRVARARRIRGGQQPSPGFRDPVTSNPSGGIRGDIRIRRRHREAPAAECDAGCNSPPAAPGTPDASGYRLSAGNRGCGDGR